jgi:nucleoside 2-deoxyribosyltransferase
MTVCYIAGPFRAATPWLVEQNVRAAEALALEVWRLGAAAVCPHANTRFMDKAAPDDVFLRGDLAILERCDALLTLDAWQQSRGARDEVTHAVARGIPVFHALSELAAWLAKQPVRWI